MSGSREDIGLYLAEWNMSVKERTTLKEVSRLQKLQRAEQDRRRLTDEIAAMRLSDSVLTDEEREAAAVEARDRIKRRFGAPTIPLHGEKL